MDLRSVKPVVIFQFAMLTFTIAIVFDHLCGWHFFHQNMDATQKNTTIYPQNDAENSHQMFPFQACFRGELLRGQLRRSPEAAGGRKSIGVGKYNGDGLLIIRIYYGRPLKSPCFS